MFKAAIPAVMVVSFALPMQAAYAQALAPAAPVEKTEASLVIRPAQILAIGVGIAGGLIVGEALFSTELGMVVGGALGGYLAHVWYSGRQIEFHVGNVPKI